MKRAGVLFFLIVFAGAPALTQPTSGVVPDGETVLRRIEANYDGITDYTVTLNVTVNMERIKVPPTTLTMYFKQPDKVHFDAAGFAMVPRQAVAFNFGRLRARYDVEPSVATDSVAGRIEYRVVLLPKNDKTGLRRVQLFVDPLHWTPDSIRIPTLEGRVMTAGITSQAVEGRWLPAEITVTFGAASGDSALTNLMEEVAPNRRRSQPVSGSAVIRYSDYKLNTGLSDDLFKEEEAPLERRER
jgi:hypothetical protein